MIEQFLGNPMKKSTVICFFVIGIFFGYIAGMFHQAAQKMHRENCPTCRLEVKK